ncbi:hypothetical protein AcW1_004830 [Taiwanofungus camphoratus]|nr:hypothetical protein AcW1_004830 [Antrodia cinnamomea]KAI0960272.1 hypothetical protein AcW1_004830 [Antrodia cinnamomea]
MIQLKHPPLTSNAARCCTHASRFGFSATPSRIALPNHYRPFPTPSSPSRHPGTNRRVHCPPSRAAARAHTCHLPPHLIAVSSSASRALPLAAIPEPAASPAHTHDRLRPDYRILISPPRTCYMQDSVEIGIGGGRASPRRHNERLCTQSPPPPGTASHSQPVPASAPRFVSFARRRPGLPLLDWWRPWSSPSPSSGSRHTCCTAVRPSLSLLSQLLRDVCAVTSWSTRVCAGQCHVPP